MTEELHHFIDGKSVKGNSGRFGDVYNPATGEVTKKVPLATADEVRAAIQSAAAALPAWAATPPARRTAGRRWTRRSSCASTRVRSLRTVSFLGTARRRGSVRSVTPVAATSTSVRPARYGTTSLAPSPRRLTQLTVWCACMCVLVRVAEGGE